jgi:hypothetical protein
MVFEAAPVAPARLSLVILGCKRLLFDMFVVFPPPVIEVVG